MKKFSSTWLFGILVLGFAFYVYQFEYLAVEEQKEADEQAKLLVAADPSEIIKVELIYEGKSTLLEKGEVDWMMTQPVKDLADQAEVEDVLRTITEEKGELIVEGDSVDFEEFGLDKPKGKLHVTTDSAVHSFSVGTVTSFDGEYYIQPKDEKKVLLVKPIFADLLQRPIKELRDKKLFRSPVAPIELIFRSDRSMKLVKKKSEWQIAGERAAVDVDKVASFLSELNNFQVSNFISESKDQKLLTEYLLSKPALEITIKEKSGESIKESKITFGRDKLGKRYLVHSARNGIYEIPGHQLADFNKQANDFKDPSQPFGFESKLVERLSLVHPELSIEIKREGDQWTQAKPVDGKELDQPKIDQVIKSLSELKVDHFFGKTAAERLNKTENKVVLAAADGSVLFELRWDGPFEREVEKDKTEKLYYAKTNLGFETLGLQLSKLDGLSFSNILKNVEGKKKDTNKNGN